LRVFRILVEQIFSFQWIVLQIEQLVHILFFSFNVFPISLT